jgi:hypothetical protein
MLGDPPPLDLLEEFVKKKEPYVPQTNNMNNGLDES